MNPIYHDSYYNNYESKPMSEDIPFILGVSGNFRMVSKPPKDFKGHDFQVDAFVAKSRFQEIHFGFIYQNVYVDEDNPSKLYFQCNELFRNYDYDWEYLTKDYCKNISEILVSDIYDVYAEKEYIVNIEQMRFLFSDNSVIELKPESFYKRK